MRDDEISHRSSAVFNCFVDFDFFFLCAFRFLDIKTHKRMRKAKFAEKKVRVLLEVAF